MMTETLTNFIHSKLFTRLIILLVGIFTVWLLVQLIKKRGLSRIKDNESRYRAKKISNFLGVFLLIILSLIVFSDELRGLSIALGVAGAGIAFALQEVIVSFAGWLTILFGGFYKPGDRVQLGGIKGDVMDIGVLRTTLMETGQWVGGDLYNGRIVLIANSFVFKEPVFNYSGDFPFLWDEVVIPIQYGSNYEKCKEILMGLGKSVENEVTIESKNKWKRLQLKYRLEDAKIEPAVTIVATDNWVEFTLRYVVDYKVRRSTKSNIMLSLLKEIESSNGEIKIASATFQLVQAPDLNVQIKNNVL